MSQRKTVKMFAENSDFALVPAGDRSAHFAALVAADSVRARRLAGVPPHADPRVAACWSISLSVELRGHLERRRGSVTLADYLLWLLRLGTGAVDEAPVADPVPAGFAKVGGKLCCSNCGSVFLPAPKSICEWRSGSPYELEPALTRLGNPQPAVTPIHPLRAFSVPGVSELVSRLGVGRRVLLLVGVGTPPVAGGKVSAITAPARAGGRPIFPLSAYDVEDARHQIGPLLQRVDGVFSCVTVECPGPEVERWAAGSEAGFFQRVYPGTAVLLMTIERLS